MEDFEVVLTLTSWVVESDFLAEGALKGGVLLPKAAVWGFFIHISLWSNLGP